MTCGAVLPEASVVFVILLVARKTIPRRRLQICNGSRVEVTFRASCFGMFALEFENKSGMSEVIPKPVHAIVTGKAIRPKGKDMRLGEDNIHLTMTGIAGGGRKSRNVVAVTIRAGRGWKWVTVQREAQRLMRKFVVAQFGQ